MFHYFKQRKMDKATAKGLFDQAVAQARQPFFYENCYVPDSFDGRFEMICLHNFILIHQLNRAGQKRLGQHLFDAFFTNMELSLRELGIGDVGIPKHMKRMMQGFNGRCQHYNMTVKNKDNDALKTALLRNVYGTTTPPSDAVLDGFMDYIRESLAAEQGFTTPNQGLAA